jgi:pimeloyl-ACP methyl ester carboxylesterase/predicted glycosyltransferase
MRARYPDRDGYAERDGVKTFFEVFGEGDRTLLLLPAWAILHSRLWKMQVPYLARHYRVVTFDPRGNGRSDRPTGGTSYTSAQYADDALAVLDATGTASAVVVSLSRGAAYSLRMVAAAPERVAAQVFICPTTPLAPPPAPRLPFIQTFEEQTQDDAGWAMDNAWFWRRSYPEFSEFFFAQAFPEPHSTKQIEDAVGWAGETTAETLIDTRLGMHTDTPEDFRVLADQVRCPSLVIQGSLDHIVGAAAGPALAAALGSSARLFVLPDSGHAPQARDPVKINLLIREFVDALPPANGTSGSIRPATAAGSRRQSRRRSRRRRVLFISSPIGLGHIRRDVAIADALRLRHPEVEIDWLAQHPVTVVLRAAGERVHPASELLANESSHIEGESGEHDLHCFQAWRRMDEILCANFMLFHDLVTREEPYDLWIGDEAWELDYYLHENPTQKRAAYAWMTDFVGWLPMPDGGSREERVAADYNAEMIEHIARHPAIRDRAIFVGGPEDIVPDTFGSGLPSIRGWTEQHYDFSGAYITGFAPDEFADRDAVRAELGYGADEEVCVVTVGGSGVGVDLLSKVMDAYQEARAAVPELRMVVVAGPRIDPTSLPNRNGIEIRGYVPDLYRHLAVCDLAVVQGGLTTTMELAANSRPFLYFPLRHHFEQNFHVTHRLDGHRAGRRMDYATATPETVAGAIAAEIGRPVDYRAVPADGAARAADLLADLL